MRRVEETATIPFEQAAVFAAASDPEIQLIWDAATFKKVEKLTDGPLAQGSRYRGEAKGFGSFEYSFSVFEPSRTFQHLAKMKFGEIHHTFEFATEGAGTRMSQAFEVEANMMGKLMWPVMKGQIAKRAGTIVAELSAYLARA